MLLFLIRHGQTEANVAAVYSGQTDVMLTEQGREQAAALRPLLERYEFDRVYSSDLTRAVETQRLAVPDREGIRTPLLREIDVGSAAGCSIAKIARDHGDPKGNFTPFGGENYAQLTDRLREFLSRLEADPCQCAVAFSHGGLIKCMLHIVTGLGTNVVPVANGNCNVTVFRFDGTRWNLMAWNLAGDFWSLT